MAILFSDSFDDGKPSESGKYTSAADGVNVSISGSGRTGNALSIAVVGNVNGIKTFASTYATLYAGIAIQHSNPRQANSFLAFQDSGTDQVYLAINSSGYLEIYRGGGTLLATSTVILSNTAFNTVEFKCVIDNSGSYEIRINTAAGLSEIMTGTGVDTQNTANAYATSVKIYNDNNSAILLDDFWVDSASFLGPCKIYKLDPDGAGNTTGWTPSAGSNYQNVDDHPHDSDTTYNSASASTTKDTYAMEASGLSTGTVRGVVVNITAKKDDATSRSFYPVVRSGGTDYDGSSTSLTTSYVTYQHILETDPATAAAWAFAAIDAMECGIKVV